MATSITEEQPGLGALQADFPRSLAQFESRFGTEDQCRGHLMKIRWPNGFVCPNCGVVGEPWGPTNRGLLVCSSCEYHCSLTAGTLFHRSKRPLTDWFRAIYFITEHSKQGVSALGMKNFMRFGSMETAWAWLHKLRGYMTAECEALLSGEVEVDEALFGGYLEGGTPGLGSDNKIKVAIAVERRGRGCGRTRMAVIPNRQGPVLRAFVRGAVEQGSLLATDANRGYYNLAKEGFDIDVRSGTKNSIPIRGISGRPMAEIHLKRVHLVISLMKRIIYTTHQGSFTERHLQAYLDEFAFRFNRRDPKRKPAHHPMRRFQEMLDRACRAKCRPTYMLFGRTGPRTPVSPKTTKSRWLALDKALAVYRGEK